MPVVINSVSINPNPVDTGSTFVVAVDADFLPMQYDYTDAVKWDIFEGIAWDDIDVVANNGLVAYYTADSVVGTKLKDLSGNGLDGTISGAVAVSPAGIRFDGSKYVSIPNNALLQQTKDFTIEITFTPTNIAKGRQNILNKAYGGEYTYTQETSAVMAFYHGIYGGDGGSYSANVSPAIADHNEVTLTALSNSLNSTVQWYKDGVLASTQADTYPTRVASPNAVQIALGYTGVYWEGYIKSIKIYNRLLTQAEIKKHADAAETVKVNFTNDGDASVTYSKITDPIYGKAVEIVKPDATNVFSIWTVPVGFLKAGTHTITWAMKTTNVANMAGYSNNLFAEVYLPNSGTYSPQHVSGTTGWTEYSFTYTNAADDPNFTLWLVIDRAFGTADFARIAVDGIIYTY